MRGGTLAKAGGRLGVDASTVFRSVQRIEKQLALAAHAERIKSELEARTGCRVAAGLWPLAHPESRHLRRIAAVYQHFSQLIRLHG